MGRENSIIEEKPISLSQVNQTFMDKILARNSCVGHSIRTFQSQNIASVPFDWEEKPGNPKHPQTDEIIPPISPPPVLLSQTFPTPKFASTTKHNTMSCFWKKSWGWRPKTFKGKGRRGKHAQGNGKDNKNKNPAIVDQSSDGTISSSSEQHSRTSSSSSSSVSPSSNSSSNSSSSSSSLRSFAKGLFKRSS